MGTTVEAIAQLPGYKLVTPGEALATIKTAYTGDLLSDVMGNAPSDSVLVTIQAHKNTVAVASLVGAHALVICNGRSVPDDMTEAAREESVAIITTADNQFTVSYKIATLLALVHQS